MAPALHLPTDSDSDAAAPLAGRRPTDSGRGSAPRRLALLGLGALGLAGCALAATAAHRSPQLHGTSAVGAAAAMSGEEGSDTLAGILLAASPDVASEDSLAAALLDGGDGHPAVGAGELLEGLLEEHDHDGTAERAEGLAGSLQQKFSVTQIATPVALMNVALRAKYEGAWWMGGKHKPEKPVDWLWPLFKNADMDSNGVVEGSELESLSKALRLHCKLTADGYDQLYAQAGMSKGGKLNFEEVKQLAGVIFVFSAADKDRDGALSSKELGTGAFVLAKQLAWAHLAPNDFAKLLGEADADADGNLGPAELKHLLKAAHDFALPWSLAGLFKKLDVDESESLEGSELNEVSAVLQKEFRLEPSHIKTILAHSPNGSIVELDRRAFKQLLWNAWGGSPFAGVGPWKMIVFFKEADKDANCFLEGKELDSVTTSLQKAFWLKGSAGRKLVGTVDDNSDGKLSPREFVKLLQQAKDRSPFAKMCRKEVGLFKSLDVNGNHAIDGPELNSLSWKMQQWFKEATLEHISKAVASADADADGKLTPPELRQVILTLASLPPTVDVAGRENLAASPSRPALRPATGRLTSA